VLRVVVVGGSEVGAHAAVVASDDHSTPSGRLRGIHAVLDTQASFLDSFVKDLGILVVTDTANVHDAVGLQNVLRTTGSVLGRSTC
jgi:hypothetical protein